MTKYQILFAVWLAALPVSAQQLVQVVTKTIERQMPAAEDVRVRLNTQKADIVLKGWNKNTVSVVLRITARHADKAVAQKDLDYLQYDIRRNGDEIDLSNRVSVPKSAGPLRSSLKIAYEVWVPARCRLTLDNTFGDMQLADLQGETMVKMEFGKLTLTNVAGKLGITSDYGDIEASRLRTQLVCNARKADLVFQDLAGTADFQTRYGKLHVQASEKLTRMTVTAARTNVVFDPKRVDDFNYDVETSYAAIQVPDSHRRHLGEYIQKQTFVYRPDAARPAVSITNSYSPITIHLGWQSLR